MWLSFSLACVLDNYDDARKKLPEAELFSDIQSDTESGAKKPRRIM